MEEATKDLEERLAVVEKKLKVRERDVFVLLSALRALAQARIMGDPLDDFFGSPENWEVLPPEDSPNQCGMECTAAFVQSLKLCQGKAGAEAEKCKAEAQRRLSRCLSSCWAI